MSIIALNSDKKQQILAAALELHDNGDFGILKDDLVTMFNCAIPHEELNEPQKRHEVFFAFRNLFNFLQQVEMYVDDDIKGVNII